MLFCEQALAFLLLMLRFVSRLVDVQYGEDSSSLINMRNREDSFNLINVWNEEDSFNLINAR